MNTYTYTCKTCGKPGTLHTSYGQPTGEPTCPPCWETKLIDLSLAWIRANPNGATLEALCEHLKTVPGMERSAGCALPPIHPNIVEGYLRRTGKVRKQTMLTMTDMGGTFTIDGGDAR